MTITYRTSGAWGAGKGAPLTGADLDRNFWGLDQRLADLEGSLPVPESVASLSQSGPAVTLHGSAGTTIGTFDLPAPAIVHRGAWAPTTSYLPGDVVSLHGMAALCQSRHTAAGAWWVDYAAGRWRVLTGWGCPSPTGIEDLGSLSVVTLVVPEGLALAPGMRVRVEATLVLDTWIEGEIVAYVAGTAPGWDLAVQVSAVSGSAATGWVVGVTTGGGTGGGWGGAAEDIGALPVTLDLTHAGKILICTTPGTVTLPTGVPEDYVVTLVAADDVVVTVQGPFAPMHMSGEARTWRWTGSAYLQLAAARPLLPSAAPPSRRVEVAAPTGTLLRQDVVAYADAGAWVPWATCAWLAVDGAGTANAETGLAWAWTLPGGQALTIGDGGVGVGVSPSGPGTVTATAYHDGYGDVVVDSYGLRLWPWAEEELPAVEDDPLLLTCMPGQGWDGNPRLVYAQSGTWRRLLYAGDPPQLPVASVATLPPPADWPQAVVWCSDGDAGTACLAVSDGTDWRRVPLGAAVSTT